MFSPNTKIPVENHLGICNGRYDQVFLKGLFKQFAIFTNLLKYLLIYQIFANLQVFCKFSQFF